MTCVKYWVCTQCYFFTYIYIKHLELSPSIYFYMFSVYLLFYYYCCYTKAPSHIPRFFLCKKKEACVMKPPQQQRALDPDYKHHYMFQDHVLFWYHFLIIHVISTKFLDFPLALIALWIFWFLTLCSDIASLDCVQWFIEIIILFEPKPYPESPVVRWVYVGAQ